MFQVGFWGCNHYWSFPILGPGASSVKSTIDESSSQLEFLVGHGVKCWGLNSIGAGGTSRKDW